MRGGVNRLTDGKELARWTDEGWSFQAGRTRRARRQRRGRRAGEP